MASDLLERARAVGAVQTGLHLQVAQQQLVDAPGSVREVVGGRSGVTILKVASLEREAG